TFFAARIPAPQFEYEDLNGLSRKVVTESGGPTLLTIFSSWCPVCAEEIPALAKRTKELRAAGLSNVLLAVDPLDPDNGIGPDEIREMLDKQKVKFRTGLASAELIARLQFLHDAVYPFHEQVAVPWSVLIDREGRLAAFYIGRIDIDQLLKDVGNLDAGPAELMHLASPAKGKWYAPHVDVNLVEVAKAYREHEFLEDAAVIYQQLAGDEETAPGAYYYLGTLRQKQQRWQEAAESYRESLKRKSDYTTHHNLAQVLIHLSEHDEAIVHFYKARELDPDDHLVAYNFAQRLLDLQKFVEAEEQLRAVIAIKADHVEAIVRLGGLLVDQGQAENALALYEKSLTLVPDNASIFNGMGLALESQNKLKE
ncbi:MAG: tetratricopeptide repeat protein, partial [Pirellulaceae bacterium]|nr:tetratricopeptide repeat protein [Pirellulaceae bacterium]